MNHTHTEIIRDVCELWSIEVLIAKLVHPHLPYSIAMHFCEELHGFNLPSMRHGNLARMTNQTLLSLSDVAKVGDMVHLILLLYLL